MQVKFFIIYALIFFACLTKISAQIKISGNIIDTATKEKLPGATVTLENASKKYTVTTNTNGEFIFENISKGDYMIAAVVQQMYVCSRLR